MQGTSSSLMALEVGDKVSWETSYLGGQLMGSVPVYRAGYPKAGLVSFQREVKKREGPIQIGGMKSTRTRSWREEGGSFRGRFLHSAWSTAERTDEVSADSGALASGG